MLQDAGDAVVTSLDPRLKRREVAESNLNGRLYCFSHGIEFLLVIDLFLLRKFSYVHVRGRKGVSQFNYSKKLLFQP